MGEVDDEIKFKRYLYFLTETQHYIVQKNENLFNNKIESLLNLLAAEKINKIIEIIEEANKFDWLPNRNVLLHVLAVCTKTSDSPSVKTASYSCAARLIKNIEELIQFISYERALQKNASAGLRRVIKLWYLEQDSEKLFDAIVNVRSCQGWKHRDILRQAHIKAKDEDKRVLLAYAAKGLEHAKKQGTDKTKELIDKLEAIDAWRSCKDEKKAVEIACKPNSTYKTAPGALLRSAPLWSALIPHMSLDQLILELSRFHRLGMFKLNQPSLQTVVDSLGDAQKCRNSSLQPATVLYHMKLFERPRPIDPKLREYLQNLAKNKKEGANTEKTETAQVEKVEKPVFSRSHAVTAALGRLLHHSLRNVKPIPVARRPKMILLTVEVRGGEGVEGLLRPSFGCPSIRYGEIVALIYLILQRLVSDKHLSLACFNGSENLIPIQLTTEKDKAALTLAQILQKLRKTGAQTKVGANPSRSLRYAIESKKVVDVFINVIVTGDSVGRIPKPERPKEDVGVGYENLIKYRQKTKVSNAKMLNLALCGRNLQHFVQVIPTCPGYLNVAGFNTVVPSLISSFVSAPMF